MRVFWIDVPDRGGLAIVSRPLGGDRLAPEIAELRAHGFDSVLSLLESEEVKELGLEAEAATCAEHALAFHAFPIADRGLPGDKTAFETVTGLLANGIAKGGKVAVHCRAGIGRSSLAAARILVRLGVPGVETLDLISRARGLSVPDTDEQRWWIKSLVV